MNSFIFKPSRYLTKNYHILGLDIYSDRLVNEGIVTQDDVKNVRDKYEKICEEAFELAKKETHIKVILKKKKQNG